MLGEQRGKYVATVNLDASDPREVVEPGVIKVHFTRSDSEPAREQALETDRHVAQPHRPVALLNQGAGDNPDRVREVDDPRILRRALAHGLSDVEHDGHRAHRLSEATSTSGLLANAITRQRKRLVARASGLTTNAQLEQHSRRTVDRSVAVSRQSQASRSAALVQDALRETTHDVESLGVRIQQHELGNIELISEPG